MNNCPICAQKAYIAFNWKYANEGKDKELAGLAQHLQPIRPLKFGHLYQCPASADYWFLNEERSLIYSVPPDKVELLWQWNSQPLVLTDAQLKVLSKIGATESGKDGIAKVEIRIPCAVKRAKDELYDPALAIITKMPPIQRWQKRVFLGSNSDLIEESDLALPRNVRIATYNAPEINMGFAPTLVKSADNRYFVLNGTTQIFSFDQQKGKDISLSKRPFRRGDNFPIVNEEMGQVAFFYFDWHAGCRELVREPAN